MTEYFICSIFFILGCLVGVTGDDIVEIYTLPTTTVPKLPKGWSTYRGVVSDFWQWRLQQSPEFATSLGNHDYDDRLETFTFEAFTHRKTKCDEFLFRINGLQTDDLTEWEKVNIALLRDNIQTYVDGYRWSRLSTLNPINFLEGLHKDFSYWLDAMPFEVEQHFRIYIQRLRALATQVHEQVHLMQEAVRAGWTSHRLSVEPVLDALDALDHHPVTSPFYRPFNQSLEESGMSRGKIERYSGEGLAVIFDHVLPAYRSLRYFLSQEYIPHSRPMVGIYSLPGGEEYYRDCIQWYLAEDIQPIELHQRALLEIENIRQRIDKIRQQTGYLGSVTNFIRYTQKAAKFNFIREEDLLGEYRRLIAQIPGRLKWIFKNITITPLVVQPMPFDGPLGVTIPPSEDGTMPGIFFVNVRRPHKRPKWMLKRLVLQETLPGHYLQACYALNQSVPRMRRVIDFRKQHAVPFQFPFHSAFIEGWSLYAGTLGYELGLYEQPYDEYGQLFHELYKMAQVVVDTGIHALGWNRNQGVQYMISTAGTTRHLAERDVDTFITLPGQALADGMGMMKFKQLRRQAESLLGSQFNLKEFHHQLLRLGPISLRSLERSIHIWLAYQVEVPLSELTSGARACDTLQILFVTLTHIYLFLYLQR